MEKKKGSINRRGFLKGAAVSAAAGAAALVTPPIVSGSAAAPAPPTPAPPEPLRPTPEELLELEAAEMAAPPADVDEDMLTVENPGSDFMVDVLKTLDFEYIAANCTSTARGIHESLDSYGGNKNPEWLTCTHEEVAMNICNGYYAVEGKPMLTITFSPPGLLHASMAIHGAYSAHTPTYIMVCNIIDANYRRPGVDWGGHSMMDPAAVVRDILKWDDSPASLQHFAESTVRAYKIAMTEPRGPVLIGVDAGLQELAIPDRSKLRIPKLVMTNPPAADQGTINEVAKLLVNAESPLIIAGDVARDEEGSRLLIELAETLQCPVQGGGRAMPNRHPLSLGGLVGSADVILGLNKSRFFGDLNTTRDQHIKTAVRRTKPGAKVILISSGELYQKGNFQHIDRYTEVDMSVGADPQATLPSLIEACKKLITADRKRTFEARGKRYAEMSAAALQREKAECIYGWDSSPISQPRLEAEIWDVIKHKDWAQVGARDHGGRRWNVDKFYRLMGEANGGGVGGSLPLAIGAALAHRKHGRLCVAFQPDGDMMYVPGALWTATHHRIPLLLIMHNNYAYHQEIMHLQRIAARRQRGQDWVHKGGIGVVIRDPNIDFAQLARSMGAYAEGPISDPKDIRPALLRAVERVEKGEVALLDTVVQPR